MTSRIGRLSAYLRGRYTSWAPIAVPTHDDLVERWPNGVRTLWTPAAVPFMAGGGALTVLLPVAFIEPIAWMFSAIPVGFLIHRPLSWLIPQARFLRARMEQVRPRMWIVLTDDIEHGGGPGSTVSAVTAVFRHFGQNHQQFQIALANGRVLEGAADDELVVAEVQDRWAAKRLGGGEVTPEDTNALFALVDATIAAIPAASRHGITEAEVNAVRDEVQARESLTPEESEAMLGFRDGRKWLPVAELDEILVRAERLGLLRRTPRGNRPIRITEAGYIWYAQEARLRGQEVVEDARQDAAARLAQTPAGSVRAPETVTVLFIAASPEDLTPLRLDHEVRDIQHRVRLSEHRDSVRFSWRLAVQPLDLLQYLNEERPHIVHFSGHGNQHGLAFEDVDGHVKPVSNAQLASLLSAASDRIRLAVFNSCSSSSQARAACAHIDAAIGMEHSVHDDGAKIFAAQFYNALGFGHNLRTAFDQACAALELETGRLSGNPQLFVAPQLDAREIVLVAPAVE